MTAARQGAGRQAQNDLLAFQQQIQQPQNYLHQQQNYSQPQQQLYNQMYAAPTNYQQSPYQHLYNLQQDQTQNQQNLYLQQFDQSRIQMSKFCYAKILRAF